MEHGQEVTVSDSPITDQDRAQWPYEITFDGGARSIAGKAKAAGAGAARWHHPTTGGPPSRIASR
eukprot:5930967-Pyramimonas_sp.AAC.1